MVIETNISIKRLYQKILKIRPNESKIIIVTLLYFIFTRLVMYTDIMK